jgi:hypothetical protein
MKANIIVFNRNSTILFQKSFRIFLYFEYLIILPLFTLQTYLLMTLLFSGKPIIPNLLKYVSLALQIIAMELRQRNLANICNDAYEDLRAMKREIIMQSCNSDQSDSDTQHRLRSILNVLGTCRIMNGNGYFVVRAKFERSKSTSLKSYFKFKVNNGVVTDIVGTVATFLVVLIQFNLSEKGGV